MLFRRAAAPLTIPALALLGVLVPSEANSSASYTYDGTGRLSTAHYDNGLCVAYLYDASGNRTSQTNTLAGPPVTHVWGSGVWGCFAWSP